MSTKFIGYLPEVKTWVNRETGEPISLDRVRINIIDDHVPEVVGADIQYYMIKKEELLSICGVHEYHELKLFIGHECNVNMRFDVRTQKASLSEIKFM